jgi:hypothetical protein
MVACRHSFPCCQRDLGAAVTQLKQDPGNGLSVSGVTLALLRLIDEYDPGIHRFSSIGKKLDLDAARTTCP